MKRQFGNLARHTWGTLGEHLGHKIELPVAHLGNTWGKSYLGTVGAQLGANTVGAQLGHTWRTVEAKVT